MISLMVINGDQLKFDPLFGSRQVTLIEPALIRGSGGVRVANEPVCIVGDEQNVQLKATYTTPTYSIAGMGTVTISRLNDDQQASHCKNGQALITQGTTFDAQFTPSTPASMPGAPPQFDSTAPSSGSGEFRPAQRFASAGSP